MKLFSLKKKGEEIPFFIKKKKKKKIDTQIFYFLFLNNEFV
jgi:hypothetical protein